MDCSHILVVEGMVELGAGNRCILLEVYDCISN